MGPECENGLAHVVDLQHYRQVLLCSAREFKSTTANTRFSPPRWQQRTSSTPPPRPPYLQLGDSLLEELYPYLLRHVRLVLRAETAVELQHVRAYLSLPAGRRVLTRAGPGPRPSLIHELDVGNRAMSQRRRHLPVLRVGELSCLPSTPTFFFSRGAPKNLNRCTSQEARQKIVHFTSPAAGDPKNRGTQRGRN